MKSKLIPRFSISLQSTTNLENWVAKRLFKTEKWIGRFWVKFRSKVIYPLMNCRWVASLHFSKYWTSQPGWQSRILNKADCTLTAFWLQEFNWVKLLKISVSRQELWSTTSSWTRWMSGPPTKTEINSKSLVSKISKWKWRQDLLTWVTRATWTALFRFSQT